jgi:hypothetical protein
MPADPTALDWASWRGLPHEIGADPREGRAACCLVIAVLTLHAYDVATPPLEPMLDAARNADWTALEEVFREHCNPISEAAVPSITLLRNVNGLGVGTVIAPNTLITLDHKRGVITLPINRLRCIQFYTVKQ